MARNFKATSRYTSTADDSLVQTNGIGIATLSVELQHFGDVMVRSVRVFSSGITVLSVCGTGLMRQKCSSMTAGCGDTKMSLGTAMATGNSTVALSSSSIVESNSTEFYAQEFSWSIGASTARALDVADNTSIASSSTTMTLSTVTSASANDFCVDDTLVDDSGLVVSTSDFTNDVSSVECHFNHDSKGTAIVSAITSLTLLGQRRDI